MADSSEAHNRLVDQNDDVRLNITSTELKAVLNTAINNVVDRVLKDHKRKGNNTPMQICKKGKTGLNYNQSKPKEAKPECKICGKKRHFSKCIYEQIRGCGICKERNHKTHECKGLKNNRQSGEKPRCKICRKQHVGKCTIDPRTNLCGICKTKGHKALDCKKLENATCHGCGKKGHISTNCPTAAKGKAIKSGSNKGNQRTEGKPRCSTCQKRHFGKCRLETQSQSGSPACGLCKSKDHKTIECKKIKDATCFNCHDKGHIKTNCPKYAKKPEEGKKTNARVFRMDAREAVQDDNVSTGTFLVNDV